MPSVHRHHHRPRAERLAYRAYQAELKRDPTAAELQPAQAQARTLIDNERSDKFIMKTLKGPLDGSPEGQAIDQANGAMKALLGREADGALLQQARELAAQGVATADIRTQLESTLKAGAEYRSAHVSETVNAAYERELGRKPSHEKIDGVNEQHEALKATREMIDQGMTGEQVDAAWHDKLSVTVEGRKFHAADNVNGVYAFELGRAPSAEELDKGVTAVRSLIDQGKSNDEINGGLVYGVRTTPEWQQKHPQMNHNRDDIIMRQPTSWSCGATSLAMAMVAAGKRPRNEDSIWEMAQPDKLDIMVSHSTDKSPWQIADIARGMGVNAEGHAGASVADMKAALAAGHGIMVNVKEPDTGGHFIYISGLDAQGQIQLCDPWHPETTTWSDDTLAAYSRAAPGPGNFIEFWPQ